MSKTHTNETQETETLILYDSRIEQRIPLILHKNGKQYNLCHIIAPLDPDRFFEMERAAEQTASKLKKLSTDIYGPKQKLWSDLVQGREGYKDRADWKTATHQSDCIAVINALLHADVLSNDDTEITTDEILFDDEELTVIAFNALQSGALITNMMHSFRQETKAEMDEFLALQTNEPNPNELASAIKLTKSEKLCRLGQRLLKGSTGYAEGSDIPPWHLAATTESFFIRQINRMGKSLAG